MNKRLKFTEHRQYNSVYDTLIEICLIFLIIFTPLAYGAVEPWAIAVLQITAALMFLIWILKTLSNGKIEFISNPVIFIFLPFVLYVIIQFLISLYTIHDSKHNISGSIYPWATKTEILKVIAYSLIFLVTINTFKSKSQITRILSVIITTGFIMSILFMMRYFGVNIPWGIINPDHYSAYFGMIIPLAFVFLFIRHESQEARSTTYAKVFLFFFCIVTISTALFFTMSRGGMFSFIAVLLFIAILSLGRKSVRRKGWILSAILTFIILTIVWIGATPVVERLLSIKAEIASMYIGGRLPIWEGTTGIIKDHLIFGTGFGTFNYIFPKYQPSEIILKHYTHAHSDFLEIFSDTGMVGFTLFIICIVWSIAWLFQRFYRRHNPYVVSISIGLFGSLAGIFVHSFVDFNLRIPANAVLVTIILGLLISVLHYKKRTWVKTYELQSMKYLLYPVSITLIFVFIIVSIRPALAYHYFQKASISQPAHDKRLIEKLLSRAISLDPLNALYHHAYGKSFSDLSKRLQIYKKAIRLNPTNAKYHQSLAWTYGQLADFYAMSFGINTPYYKFYSDLAQKEFQQAIMLDPNNPYRHRAFAIWLFSHPTKKNIDKAVATYRKVLEVVPDLTEEAMREYHKIQKDYIKTVDILPGSKESDYSAFSFLVKEKGLKFAIDFAKKYLKTYHNNGEIHFLIADKSFYDRNYSWEFTENHYKIAFKIDPKNALYRMWHGIHLYLRREYKEARKNLQMALKMGLKPHEERLSREYLAKTQINM
jgi:O-antigen ligase/Tfp pilus assembly protein PilF